MHTFADPLNTSMDSPYTRFLSLHPGPLLTVWSSLWFAGEYTHTPNPQQVGEDSDGWLPQQPELGTGCDSLHLPVASLRLACAPIPGSGDTHYSHLSGGMQRPPPHFSSWDQESTGSSSCQHSLRYPQPGPIPEVGTLSLMPIS